MGRSDTNDKIRFLKILDVLQRTTDAEHPQSTSGFCALLEEEGIHCDRRTLAADIALLIESGLDIRTEIIGRDRVYYMDSRSFDVTELRIIIDSLWAAGFLSEEKTEELAQRLSEQAGSHKVAPIRKMIVRTSDGKKSMDNVIVNIDHLGEAISRRQKASFRYFDIDIHKQRSYRADGGRYVVSPLGLVINDGKYYLLAYSEAHSEIRTYRVDRMENVLTVNEPIPGEYSRKRRLKVAEYSKQCFGMHSGRLENIGLSFSDELLGSVYDKFGEGVRVWRSGEKKLCTVSVPIQVSPPFFAWVFQYGGRMKIVSPEHVIEEYREFLHKNINAADEPI